MALGSFGCAQRWLAWPQICLYCWFLTVLHCKDMPIAIKPRESWFWPENKNIKLKNHLCCSYKYSCVWFSICSCVWIEVCIIYILKNYNIYKIDSMYYIYSIYVYIYIYVHTCIFILYMHIKPSLLHSLSGRGDPAAWQAPLRSNIIKWRTRRIPWAVFWKITLTFTIHHPEQRAVQTSL